jgi:hypothetical protein
MASADLVNTHKLNLSLSKFMLCFSQFIKLAAYFAACQQQASSRAQHVTLKKCPFSNYRQSPADTHARSLDIIARTNSGVRIKD